MPLTLHAHPFSSYCQKVAIALHERGVSFTPCMLDPGDNTRMAEWAALWPLKRMPVLVDGDRTVVESSIIIEYLDIHHAGNTRMVPADPVRALEVRMMDRFFDNYIMTPMQKIVDDAMRPDHGHDSVGVDRARHLLDTAYRWLDGYMDGRGWAVHEAFSLADCAAAPSLFYADWAHPIDASLENLRAYRQRLLARPSVVRVVDDARPHRPLFPLGAPDRD